jgi:hypothetical protein
MRLSPLSSLVLTAGCSALPMRDKVRPCGSPDGKYCTKYCTVHLPTGNSLSTPFLPASAFHPSTTEKSDAVFTEPAPLSFPIRGIYRLLDVITEQENSDLSKKLTVAVHTMTMAPRQLIRS